MIKYFSIVCLISICLFSGCSRVCFEREKVVINHEFNQPTQLKKEITIAENGKSDYVIVIGPDVVLANIVLSVPVRV